MKKEIQINGSILKKAITLTLLIAITTLLMVMVTPTPAKAQIWKKVKDRVKRTVEDKISQKSADVTTNAMNKAEGAVQGNKAGGGTATATHSTASANQSALTGDANKASGIGAYKSYDFVPGDKIIFEPDISKEADAELPARYKIIKGNAEIQSYNGDKILHLDEGGRAIIAPLMNTESYLPEQYSVEFDMMFENKDDYMRYTSYFNIAFHKSATPYTETPLFNFRILSGSGCEWGKSGHISFPENLTQALSSGANWHHIAVYINKNVGKVYIDQYRVVASNTLPTGADKVSINIDGRYGIKMKNFRLAAGGSDKYNKVVTAGKFITHGILFDVAKSTIQATSAGTLNEVAKMMQTHPELKFEIDGHTDSDGSNNVNLQLSEARAQAVKTELVRIGISPDRLTTKGFGAAKPIDSNDTQEGKANNRRVEFIKM